MNVPTGTCRDLTALSLVLTLICTSIAHADGKDAKPSDTVRGPKAPTSAPPLTGNSASTGNTVRQSLTVELVRPRQMAMGEVLAASGSIAAWQEGSVSAQASGLRVQRVLKAVGNTVKRGEAMLEFDDENLRAELAQLRASMSEAEASHADARANAERARQVGSSGALSDQQLQQFLTAEATARARVAALQESVKLQQLRIRQTVLRAPDDGVVSVRNATLGAVVPPGFELFRIIRQGRLEWRPDVPSASLGRITTGMTARLTTDEGKSFEGKVRQVAPTVDPATRNAIVYVDLPKSASLRPGMFARGEFVIGQTQAWVLPQSALLLRDGQHQVAQVGADNRVNFVRVTPGRRQGTATEIRGIEPNVAVIESGVGFLSEGDVVRVVGPAK